MSDKFIEALSDGLRALCRYMKPHVPLRQAHVFICVANLGPVTVADLRRHVKAPPGTIYDDLQDLGKVATSGKAGAGLVQRVAGTPEGHAHQFILTVRGENAMQAIEFAMSAALLPDDEEELEAYFEAKRFTRG